MKMNNVGKIADTKLPLFARDNAYLKDFAVSNDEEAPITVGSFCLEAGKPITYTYAYEETKLIIDGKMQITDESGETVTWRTGDLFYFPKGSVITFATDTFGVGYFCGQRGADEAWGIHALTATIEQYFKRREAYESGTDWWCPNKFGETNRYWA